MTPMQEYYAGKTLFVTGGTGYMGKVFLEKIIRSLPAIKKVYILLRPKKGMNVKERAKKLITSAPFTFNNIDPEHLEKIVPITGDISKENFEMSSEDMQKLIDEVSLVFHLAASIRMDLTLKEALITNTLSTYQLLQFCKKIKHLEAVVHLSTAYCIVEVKDIDEIMYPMKINPYTLMDMIEWMDDETLKMVEKRIIKPHPNTYTFTKRLSEIVVNDMRNELPIAIARPSIVLPSLYEPTPGWVDSFNGPIGLYIAAGKGVVRSTLVNRDVVPQVIPVDVAINALVIIGYLLGTKKIDSTESVPVHNLSQGDKYKLTWGESFDYYWKLVDKYPFKKMLWYPSGYVTTNYYLNEIYTYLFHYIPAYLVDFLLVLFWQKPFLVNVQNRIHTATRVLQYFALNEWTFKYDKSLDLLKYIDVEDKKIFYTNIDVDVYKYMDTCFHGSRKYCVKEDTENILLCRIQLQALRCLDISVKVIALYWVLKFFFFVFRLIFDL